MSFDIFVSAFENEGPFHFPVAILHRAFAPYILSERSREDREGARHKVWALAFADSPGSTDIYLDGGDMVFGFGIGNPPDVIEFWEVVAGLLRDLPCLLYWPNVKPVGIIGSLDVLPHIPSQYIEKIGIPLVSTDPERIRRYVWENS
jgi:hypothetical protein